MNLVKPLTTKEDFFSEKFYLGKALTSHFVIIVPLSLLTFACSKSAVEILKKSVKYVQS